MCFVFLSTHPATNLPGMYGVVFEVAHRRAIFFGGDGLAMR
ncbi:hypothetical protein [Scytonema millei]|nr:hypothetical protein [Scytonema millei]